MSGGVIVMVSVFRLVNAKIGGVVYGSSVLTSQWADTCGRPARFAMVFRRWWTAQRVSGAFALRPGNK